MRLVDKAYDEGTDIFYAENVLEFRGFYDWDTLHEPVTDVLKAFITERLVASLRKLKQLNVDLKRNISDLSIVQFLTHKLDLRYLSLTIIDDQYGRELLHTLWPYLLPQLARVANLEVNVRFDDCNNLADAAFANVWRNIYINEAASILAVVFKRTKAIDLQRNSSP